MDRTIAAYLLTAFMLVAAAIVAGISLYYSKERSDRRQVKRERARRAERLAERESQSVSS